jgi:membrane protease YdiL (CAAX protease family)
LRDAAKLFAYFAAVVLGGAIFAPVLFWAAHGLTTNGIASFLARYDFETYFHRALLACAVIFLWPLLRGLRLRSLADLQLRQDESGWRHAATGWTLAAVPLAYVSVTLLNSGAIVLKNAIPWAAVAGITAAAIAVPIIEELFFRGLILGILLRGCRPINAAVITSAFYSVIHFLKAPDHTNAAVSWTSGFRSIAHAFSQFADPMMVLSGFATLFLVGLILADARLRTVSLWLPAGLHSGWILVSGIVSKLTKQTHDMLPLLGNNMLTGLLPLGLGIVTWALVVLLFPHANRESR